MPPSLWQLRIQRADELSRQHPYAKEILTFYIHLARFQETLHRDLKATLQSPHPTLDRELTDSELSELAPRFQKFLAVPETHGPQPLSQLARDLNSQTEAHRRDLLSDSWLAHSASDAPHLLAQAFLQPYAELLRSRATPRTHPYAHALCPFCNRKPVCGILRPMGDGAARSLLCSFCLSEWQFPRIACPGCGDQNDKSLVVFTATEPDSNLEHIRVNCCETCKTYLKTIDLTKNGHADPLVDELASAPLDLWAAEHHYAKLQRNSLGM